MSLTYSPVEGAAAIAALAPGTTLIAAVSSSETSRSFVPINAVAEDSDASAWFPSLTSATAVTKQDQIDLQTVLTYGAVTLVLKAGAADTVSSPGMVFTLDSNASVITVTGTFP